MRRVTVIVAGVPVTQGSMKAFPMKNGGSRVTHSNGSKLDAWRRSIEDAVHRQLGEEIDLMDGPLCLSAAFRLPRPKKIPKENKGKPVGRLSGDVDKYLRCLGDALTGVLITDDSRIQRVKDLTKDYAEIGAQPGVIFTVEEIDASTS